MTTIGPLMIFLQGTTVTARERKLLCHPAVGGVILFSRNYHDKEQLLRLRSDIRKISPSLIFAVDHEGGRVQRFKKGFTHLPPMRSFGRLFEKQQQQALQLIYATGRLVAMELSEVGVHTGLSPVLDLAANNATIGDRALHGSAEVVVKLAREFILGLRDGGILPVGKHFPGHGTVSGDTHTATVEDHREFIRIAANDLKVFSELIADKTLLGIMPAHVIYPQVDRSPASASEVWLKRTLRDELGFDGMVFSDDLAMSGIRTSGAEVSAKCMLDAGCDMVLICKDLQLLQTTLDELSDNDIERYAHALRTRWKNVHQALTEETAERLFDAEATQNELNLLRMKFNDAW